MKAHELAQQLLAGPDLPVVIEVSVDYGSDTQREEVGGVEPWSGDTALELVHETHDQFLERTRKAREAALQLREASLAEDTRNRIRAEELRRTAQTLAPADF